MKKIILCLGLVAVSLTSCSDDDSQTPINNVPDTGVLVKEIVYTSITDDYTETVEYTYNGNKIIKGVYDDESEEIYTYSGDLITKIEIFEGGEVTYTDTFTYDSNGRLVGYLSQEDGFTEEETFVYNENGTVTSNIGGEFGWTRTLHFANDELVKIEEDGGPVYNYAYDAKNSPFRNVTGFDKIAYVTHGDHEFFGRMHNITSIHESTEDVDYMTNTMTYNSADYPLTVNSTAIFEFDGTYEATMQYTYY